MSFEKARDLVQLAIMASVRHGGVSLAEIVAEFGVSHRTAQRMTQALESCFTGVEISEDEDRRRHWILRAPNVAALDLHDDAALEALDMAVRGAEREGRMIHARALRALREKHLMHMPRRRARRAEADAEAFLAAMDSEVRPGPRVTIQPGVAAEIREAVRGPYLVRLSYRGDDGPEEVLVEPHGILVGGRIFVIARMPDDPGGGMRHFRADRIVSARRTDRSFRLQPGFSIRDYAMRAFGAYHDPAEYGEVVWRFAPEAATAALAYSFHPDQSVEPQEDGSLVVRFHASGWLEMTWFLYQWGDAVEVLAPEGLRALTQGWRRSDFDRLP